MLITSYVPYALVSYPVAVAGLLLLRGSTDPALRRWVSGGVVLALAGTAFHAALLLPSYLGGHPDGDPDLVVLTSNLRLGHGDAAAEVRLVRAEHVQVAAFEEVTSSERTRLLEAGITETLPYVGGAPGAGAAGTMVFSAFPLSESTPVPLHHGSYRIRVAAPTPFWLVAVHTGQPINTPGDWRGDWGVLNQVVPALEGPVVVAGDFNTTLDHGPMRELLGHGLVDAARESNAGWQPTWPHWFGLITIDHVLTRGGYRAISTDTYAVPGTDHRALVARLAAR